MQSEHARRLIHSVETLAISKTKALAIAHKLRLPSDARRSILAAPVPISQPVRIAKPREITQIMRPHRWFERSVRRIVGCLSRYRVATPLDPENEACARLVRDDLRALEDDAAALAHEEHDAWRAAQVEWFKRMLRLLGRAYEAACRLHESPHHGPEHHRRVSWLLASLLDHWRIFERDLLNRRPKLRLDQHTRQRVANFLERSKKRERTLPRIVAFFGMFTAELLDSDFDRDRSWAGRYTFFVGPNDETLVVCHSQSGRVLELPLWPLDLPLPSAHLRRGNFDRGR